MNRNWRIFQRRRLPLQPRIFNGGWNRLDRRSQSATFTGNLATDGQEASEVLMVGIRMPAWAGFTHAIYQGILQYMRHHHRLWRLKTPLDSTNEMEPVRINRHWKGDGLILFRATPGEIREFERRHIAVVCISSESGHHPVPLVIPDNIEAGRIAGRHLLELGLHQFAYWGDQTRRYSRERGKGFASVIEAAGFECLQIGVEASRFANNSERWKRIRQAMLPQLRDLPKPIGILAKDDIAAATIIEACQQLGVSVPGEVAVVGIDDDEMICRTTAPPLTSVPYPGEVLGYHAAVLLDALMRDPEAQLPRETIVPVAGISVRESTDILHLQDPLIAQTVQRIRREAPTYSLQVNELVDRIALSRAAFKRRFQLLVGSSPKREIKRVRLHYLLELLRTTDWPITTIARHMRFDSVEELGRFIRRETGKTATAYRSENRLGGAASPSTWKLEAKLPVSLSESPTARL